MFHRGVWDRGCLLTRLFMSQQTVTLSQTCPNISSGIFTIRLAHVSSGVLAFKAVYIKVNSNFVLNLPKCFIWFVGFQGFYIVVNNNLISDYPSISVLRPSNDKFISVHLDFKSSKGNNLFFIRNASIQTMKTKYTWQCVMYLICFA